MRWSVSTGLMARRDAVLVAALAAAAAAVGLAGPLTLPWLVPIGVIVAVVGALVRAWVAVARARLEGRRERTERGRMLLVPVMRVTDMNPTDIGVTPATQNLLPGGRLPVYLDRDADAVIAEAIAAAFDGRGPWLVVVVGRSKVGKSRSLFQALSRVHGDPPLLVAPATGDGLRALLTPGEDLRLGRSAAVLWLDDLEPFLGQGVTTRTLGEWQAGGPRRVVVATYGGKGSERIAAATSSELATLAADVLAHAREITLGPTTSKELGELGDQLTASQLKDVERHGLAAYLVAGPVLERKFTTARHGPGEPLCPEGVAVVAVAVDWARCGCVDPIDGDVLRRLWARTVTQGGPADDGEVFTAGLDWALKPVVGNTSLLNQVDGRYAPHDFVVRLVDDASRPPPPADFVWAEAIRSVTGSEAVAVAVAAYGWGRLEETVAVFDRLRTSQIDVVAARAGYNRGVVLSELGRNQAAMDAYDDVVGRWDDDPSPELLEFVAKSLLNRAVVLASLERRTEALAAFDRFLGRYPDEPGAVLTALVERALSGKILMLLLLGRPQEALDLCDGILAGSGGGDVPPGPTTLRMARALTNRGFCLQVLGRPRDAIACFEKVLTGYAEDPMAEMHEPVTRAVEGLDLALRQSTLSPDADEEPPDLRILVARVNDLMATRADGSTLRHPAPGLQR